MTNLEVVLIYGGIGLLFTLIMSEIRRSHLDSADVAFGTTCWPVIIIAMIGWKIKKWKES